MIYTKTKGKFQRQKNSRPVDFQKTSRGVIIIKKQGVTVFGLVHEKLTLSLITSPTEVVFLFKCAVCLRKFTICIQLILPFETELACLNNYVLSV